MMGFSITKPEAGSDIASATTSAEKVGDEYVTNGNKVMITNRTLANYLLVYYLIDPHIDSKSKHDSILLVEIDRESYKADTIHVEMGIRASDTANVYFNHVKVPRENMSEQRGIDFSS